MSKPSAFRAFTSFETLEYRVLLHAVLSTPLPTQTVEINTPSTYIPLTNFFTNADDPQGLNQVVRLETSMGPVDFKMARDPVTQDLVAPATVQNFLNYVNTGRYNNSIIHSARHPASTDTGPIPLVLQGGGYALPNLATHIQQDAPVPNEFSLSNVRGTIAMAKTADDPNSATSEWFISQTDNSGILDTQNGGFTVFATVADPAKTKAGSAMKIVDKMWAQPTFGIQNTQFTDIPLVHYNAKTQPPIQIKNLVVVKNVSVMNGLNFKVVGNDNPKLVKATVVDGALVLTYTRNRKTLMGALGDQPAHITVSAVSPDGGGAVTSTFEVHVTADPGVVGVGKAADNKKITFVDGDGTTGVITISGGAGTVTFKSDDPSSITETISNGSVIVHGTNLSIDSIVMTSTGSTGLSITSDAAGDGLLTANSITSSTSMGRISAPTTKLTHDITITGNLKAVDLATFSGALSAENAGLIKVGTLDAANIDLPGTISKLVAGAINNSSIVADTAINSVTATSMTGSRIFSSVDPNVKVPSAATDFTAHGVIKKVNILSFADSDIAAATIASIKLGAVTLANDHAFGVGAMQIGSLQFTTDNPAKSVALSRLTNQAAVTSELAAQGLTANDINPFSVVIVPAA